MVLGDATFEVKLKINVTKISLKYSKKESVFDLFVESEENTRYMGCVLK